MRKFLDQSIAVRVLPVQHREIAPWALRAMQSLQLVGYPQSFLVLVGQLDHADALAFRARWRKQLGWKIHADLVLRDHLCGHAQDVGRRTVIFGERHSKRRGVLSRFPARKALQKKFEASERSTTKSVNRLIIVTDDHDVSRLRGKQR